MVGLLRVFQLQGHVLFPYIILQEKLLSLLSSSFSTGETVMPLLIPALMGCGED